MTTEPAIATPVIPPPASMSGGVDEAFYKRWNHFRVNWDAVYASTGLAEPEILTFVSADEGELIPSIYLRRSAMPGIENAREIRVTIEVVA
jgi:hypothetical protein